MNKELEKYYENLKIIETLKEGIKLNREAFEETISSEVDALKLTEEKNKELKELIKVDSLEEYNINGEKKLTNGLGIRVTTKLEYNKVDAINWALDNMKVAVYTELDKKQFETYAKGNDLDFVEKVETAIVTFPKEIKETILGGLKE